MSRISRAQALKTLQANPHARVTFWTRDATLQHRLEVPVYLDEDGELCQPHPTDIGRKCHVPAEVSQFRVIFTPKA